MQSVHESLSRLQTSYLDIVHVHDIEFGSLDQIVTETIPALIKLKVMGYVRAIGVTGLPLPIYRAVLDRCGLVGWGEGANGHILSDAGWEQLCAWRASAGRQCQGVARPVGGRGWRGASTSCAVAMLAQSSSGRGGRGAVVLSLQPPRQHAGRVSCLLAEREGREVGVGAGRGEVGTWEEPCHETCCPTSDAGILQRASLCSRSVHEMLVSLAMLRRAQSQLGHQASLRPSRSRRGCSASSHTSSPRVWALSMPRSSAWVFSPRRSANQVASGLHASGESMRGRAPRPVHRWMACHSVQLPIVPPPTPLQGPPTWHPAPPEVQAAAAAAQRIAETSGIPVTTLSIAYAVPNPAIASNLIGFSTRAEVRRAHPLC